MELDKIQGIVEKAVKDISHFEWWEYLVAIIVLVVTSFLGSYLKHKGKSFATKEDIKKLTNVVEKIKFEYVNKVEELHHQNRLIIEKMNYRQQLKLAALEKRLEAHQNAYSFWRKLLMEINYQSNVDKLVMECQSWWDENCLYLSSNARSAFQYSFSAAFRYHYLDIEDKSKMLEQIKLAGEEIVNGVELPTIGDKESAFFIENEEIQF